MLAHMTLSSDGEYCLTDATGNTVPITKEQVNAIIHANARTIDASVVPVMEAEVAQHIQTLFAKQASHPLLLDGKEVNMTAGAKHGEYSMYTNGHQLTQKSRNQSVYTSWTYIDQVELQERVVILDEKPVQIIINTFGWDALEPVVPTDPRWAGQLQHIKEVLREAIIRRVFHECPGDDYSNAYIQYEIQTRIAAMRKCNTLCQDLPTTEDAFWSNVELPPAINAPIDGWQSLIGAYRDCEDDGRDVLVNALYCSIYDTP